MAFTTLLAQIQARPSVGYLDNLTPGSTLESSSTDAEFDFNAVRTILRLISGEAKWYTQPAGRNVATLDTDLTTLQDTNIICPVQVLTNVTVGASNQYVVLNVAGSEAPSDTAGVSGGLGAVVAVLAGDVGTAALTEEAGQNALSPKNLVYIRDATTKDPITSAAGNEIFGLLQAESGVLQGETFNDTTKQVQISFVENNGSDDLALVPAADIENKVIEYIYPKRVTLSTIPEDCAFPGVKFADAVASVDVSLDNAIDNQSGAATMGQDIDIAMTDTFGWAFTDSGGTTDIFKVTADTLNSVTANTDALTFAHTIDAGFTRGLDVDTGTQTITIGGDAGAGVISGAGSPLQLAGGTTSELRFNDGFRTSSTWSIASGVPLATTAQEWTDYETAAGGEVSLLAAITGAYSAGGGNRVSAQATTTAQITAGTTVTGTGGGANLDGNLADYSAVSFVNDVAVFLNGSRLRVALAVSSGGDVYPQGTAANGDVAFEAQLESGWKLTMDVYS